MELIKSVNDWINSNIAWGPVMLILIVGTGIYLSVRCGFLQFRRFGYMWKNTIGAIGKRTEVKDKGAISPFQAMTTALAATVGTGNIAGVAGAIALGGPGAVFWMWVSALFGMVTKYSEVVLAIKFRERNAKGEWVGGPMYYITKGLGKNWKWLAVVFSAFGALAAFGIGNCTQVNTIAGSITKAIGTVTGNELTGDALIIAKLIIGVIVAAVVALVIIGGVKRIGSVTEKLVPFMSGIYII
ncbi:MAG: alanine/glycine:cation symporter family protein, partial [Christensenellales bacterium]